VTIAAEDFNTFLTADAGISAIAAGRIYWQNLPQKSATSTNLPAVVISQVSGKRPSTMEGATGLNDGRYTFSCMSFDALTTKKLSQAVRQKLSKFQGTVGSTAVLDVSLDSERDVYDSLELIFRTDLDFMIWHREP
jgi:Protein of unknown function (DUF3168)